jgi:hypothetical protein
MTSVLTKVKNRRTASRYDVRMPLRYRPAGSKQEGGWKRGHTLNVSAGGVLMHLPEATPLGRALELDIEWPGLYFDRHMVRLLVVGYVTRIDASGTVLRILNRRFCDIHPAAAGSRNRREDRAVA